MSVCVERDAGHASRSPWSIRVIAVTIRPEMRDVAFHEVCRENDLPEGGFRRAEIDGRVIVIYRLADGWYASDNACPHRGGPLAEGDLIGSEIVCPWHLWSFDVKTGVNPGSPEGREIRVCTHDVKIENGAVLVSLSEDGPEVA